MTALAPPVGLDVVRAQAAAAARAPFSALLDVLQYQIVHERGGALRVLVTPRGAAADDLLVRVRSAVVRALEEAGAAPPPVRVEAVAAIPREPGPAAKTKLVRSEAAQA